MFVSYSVYRHGDYSVHILSLSYNHVNAMSSTECSLYEVIPISSILSWPRYQVVIAFQSSGCHGDGSPQVSMGYSRWCQLQVVAPLCDPRLWPLYATPGCGPSMRLQVVAPLCDSRLWPLYAVQLCAGSGTTVFTHGRSVRNAAKGTPPHRNQSYLPDQTKRLSNRHIRDCFH